MNPRQRRGVLLMAVAGLGALAVFVSVIGYVGNVRRQVGALGPVLRLVRDMQPYEPIDSSMVEVVQVPDRWVPETAVRDIRAVEGMVAGTTLARGSYLQSGMLVARPALAQGEREIAILVDAETGVAGKVRPGSVVDIYATYAGSRERPARSQIIVTNALVIDVGDVRTERGGDDFEESAVVPVTFALTVRESLAVTYAESFADHVRLALVGGGDRTPLTREQRIFEGDPPGGAQ